MLKSHPLPQFILVGFGLILVETIELLFMILFIDFYSVFKIDCSHFKIELFH